MEVTEHATVNKVLQEWKAAPSLFPILARFKDVDHDLYLRVAFAVVEAYGLGAKELGDSLSKVLSSNEPK